MHDCLLISSGKGSRIGTFRFGESIDFTSGKGRHLQELISNLHEKDSRYDRIRASFTQEVSKNWLNPGSIYLLGWSESRESLPGGYAQTNDLGTLWVVQLRNAS